MRAIRFSRGLFVCSGSICRIFSNVLVELSAALKIFENFLFFFGIVERARSENGVIA